MLSGLRQFAKGWVAAIFIGLLVIGVAVTGVNTDLFGGVRGDQVAAGQGVAVSADEFQREVDRAIERQRAQTGQFVTRAELVEQGLHRQLLDQMVAERAVDRLTGRMGLFASDQMVAEEIRTAPAFQSDITGGFDRDQYRELLLQNGFSEAEFEEGLRRDMIRRQLLTGLAAGVRPPESFGRFVAQFEGERRIVSVAELPPERVPAPAAPTEAEIAAAYGQTRSRFATPELRTLNLVIADPQAFAERVEAPEERLRELYEFRSTQGAENARRSFLQVTTPDQASAQEAARRLAAGEDPAAIAEAVGGQFIPFEGVSRGQVPDSAVAEAAFSLPAGRSSGAIRGRLAWAAIRVTAVEDAAARPFEAMREELRAEIARDEARDLMDAAVQRYEELVSGGANPQDAAREAGLAYVTTPAVDAEGRTLAGEPAPALAGARDLLRQAFLVEANQATDFETLENGSYALAFVQAVTPPGERPLAEVRDVLAQELRVRKLQEAMRSLAEEIVAAVAGGQSFEQAVRARRLQIVADRETLDRRTALGGPLAQLGQAVFAASQGAVVFAPAPGRPSLLLAHVAEVQAVDLAENAPLIEAARQSQAQALTADLLNAFQNGAVAAARVRRNDTLLAQTMGVDPAQQDAP